MKNVFQIFLLIVVAALGVSVWDGFFILEEGQQAVITQFGKPVGQPLTEAGLKFKLHSEVKRANPFATALLWRPICSMSPSP